MFELNPNFLSGNPSQSGRIAYYSNDYSSIDNYTVTSSNSNIVEVNKNTETNQWQFKLPAKEVGQATLHIEYNYLSDGFTFTGSKDYTFVCQETPNELASLQFASNSMTINVINQCPVCGKTHGFDTKDIYPYSHGYKASSEHSAYVTGATGKDANRKPTIYYLTGTDSQASSSEAASIRYETSDTSGFGLAINALHTGETDIDVKTVTAGTNTANTVAKLHVNVSNQTPEINVQSEVVSKPYLDGSIWYYPTYIVSESANTLYSNEINFVTTGNAAAHLIALAHNSGNLVNDVTVQDPEILNIGNANTINTPMPGISGRISFKDVLGANHLVKISVGTHNSKGEVLTFTDVFQDTDHYEDIDWLASASISDGWKTGDITSEYRPYSEVKRADMAAFLYRLAGSPEYTPTDEIINYFSDVDGSTAHYKEILWLAQAEISKGWDMPEGTVEFRPYENVARADMAAFLKRLSDYKNTSSSVTPKDNSFFNDLTSDAHPEEIKWLAGAGVTMGWDNLDGSKSFKPTETVKRCDMAAFLHRMSENDLV